MRIKDWPKEDRPREKIFSKGASSLSDAELLAILLGSGNRQQDALTFAKHLLVRHGNLKSILTSSPQSLMKIKGLGLAKIAVLISIIELSNRASLNKLDDYKFATPNEMKAFLATKLSDKTSEAFACVFLDQHHRVLAYEELFYGTINETTVYPREIVKRGLYHNAARIILAHNHPSGSPRPSEADKNITTIIAQALELIDIKVLDHIIIARKKCFSFAEHDWHHLFNFKE